MILTCLPCVRQRPDDYNNYLLDSGFKVPSALKKVFLKAHQRRAHATKKGPSKKLGVGGLTLNRLAFAERDYGGEGEGRQTSVWGRGGASPSHCSDVSDDASDCMSVFSCMSRETTGMPFAKEPQAGLAGKVVGRMVNTRVIAGVQQPSKDARL